MDGTVDGIVIKDLVRRFLPAQNFGRGHAELKGKRKRCSFLKWTSEDIEIIRKHEQNLNFILLFNIPRGFPNSSIAHDNAFDLLEIIGSAATKDTDKLDQVLSTNTIGKGEARTHYAVPGPTTPCPLNHSF